MATQKPRIQNWLCNMWYRVLAAIGGNHFAKHPAPVKDPEKELDLIFEKFLSKLRPDDVFTISLELPCPLKNIITEFKMGYNAN